MAETFDNGYNSGFTPTFEENIEKDKNNEVSIRGIAREINFKDALVIQDPFTIIKEYKNVLFHKDNLTDYKIPKERAYRPEAISEQVYGTPDLWYIILMANNFKDFMELKPDLMIKVMMPNMLTNIASIIGKFHLDLSDLKEEAERYYSSDKTLRNVDFD